MAYGMTMDRWIAMLCAGALLVPACGCNTMKGLGQAVSTLGNKIEKKADQKSK